MNFLTAATLFYTRVNAYSVFAERDTSIIYILFFVHPKHGFVM